MIESRRLSGKDIKTLVKLSEESDFPAHLDKKDARFFCSRKRNCITYGIFHNNELVAVTTVSFMQTFPCSDAPHGKVAYISGVYTRPDMRGRGFATELLRQVERKAKKVKMDYICCDSKADKLFLKYGLKPSSESSLWKILGEKD